jgi:peptidoglycan hydrolase-like protein with peptidoglycan-binding domain
MKLQRLLIAQGLKPGAVDGIFGENTHVAVIAFQKSFNLTPDGIVGAKTRSALGM